jgi:Ca2+-binding RTX toxin-like protein
MRKYRGTNGRDIFEGTNRDERVFGLAGNDDLFGWGGNDELHGGKGNDLVVGDDGDDMLFGDAGSDLLAGERGNDALDGGSGYDYATYYYARAGVTVSLVRGVIDDDGNGGRDTLKSIEGVYGSTHADLIRGDAGTNELFGNAGNDVLRGDGGQDLTVGNAGADRFVFADGDVSDTVAKADLIGDFRHAERDLIDLRGLDANANAAGDQAFRYIGSGAFTGVAGELRYEVRNGETLLMGDVDGDKIADGYIRVDASQPLVAADFLL